MYQEINWFFHHAASVISFYTFVLFYSVNPDLYDHYRSLFSCYSGSFVRGAPGLQIRRTTAFSKNTNWKILKWLHVRLVVKGTTQNVQLFLYKFITLESDKIFSVLHFDPTQLPGEFYFSEVWATLTSWMNWQSKFDFFIMTQTLNIALNIGGDGITY